MSAALIVVTVAGSGEPGAVVIRRAWASMAVQELDCQRRCDRRDGARPRPPKTLHSQAARSTDACIAVWPWLDCPSALDRRSHESRAESTTVEITRLRRQFSRPRHHRHATVKVADEQKPGFEGLERQAVGRDSRPTGLRSVSSVPVPPESKKTPELADYGASAFMRRTGCYGGAGGRWKASCPGSHFRQPGFRGL